MRHARVEGSPARRAAPQTGREPAGREPGTRPRGRHFAETPTKPTKRTRPAKTARPASFASPASPAKPAARSRRQQDPVSGLHLLGTGLGVAAAVAATAAFSLTSTGVGSPQAEPGPQVPTGGDTADRASVEAAPPVVVDRSAKISRSGDRPERVKIRPADPTVVRDVSVTPMPAGCEGVVSQGWANGRLPSDQLCAPWEGAVLLRTDAARAMAELNRAYAAQFGEDMCITDGYRSYELQVATKYAKGYLAAPPGTSNHGWGLAVDLCPETYTGERGDWLAANAPAAGWENPPWAQPGGSKYEPWHWEYVSGVESAS